MLDFADFAHFYDGKGFDERQSRAHFAVIADLIECVARLYWQEQPAPNGLGITLDHDTLALIQDVDSVRPTNLFNSAAANDPAGKKDP